MLEILEIINKINERIFEMGMGNMMGMMKKAQTLQANMQKMQEELKTMDFNGQAGGDLVKVVVSGEGKAKEIEIKEELLTADNKEDLQDLILVAFNNAKEAIDEHIETENTKLMKGLNLPAGFKLPF